MFRSRIVGVLASVLLCALVIAVPAEATFPGANGKIAFVRGDDIWTINPDGTGAVNLTNSPDVEANPAWSPDGNRIAFQVGPNGGPNTKLWVMNADGSGRTQLGGVSGQDDWDPAWSPDGKQIIFLSCCLDDFALWKMNADGTGRSEVAGGFYGLDYVDWSPAGDRIAYTDETQICNARFLLHTAKLPFSDVFLVSPPSCGGPALDSFAPSWSPDAQRIAYMVIDENGFTAAEYTIRPDGTDRQQIASFGHPAWSPDGAKIAIGALAGFSTGPLSVQNADGTGYTPITSGSPPDFDPDWQPIPINTYPRPRGATPLRLSLVPAYQQCTSPNDTHGAPLSSGSCAPPQLTSTQLTVGTPDSNGKRTTMEAYIQLTTIVGTSTTPADVQITTALQDVFNKDLSDYTGQLRAELPIRITDKDNTPSPGGPGAATTEPFLFGVDVPCTATPADATVGSDCALSTTADTLYPGAIVAGKRAIWQMGRGRIDDSGPDGNPDTTADNTVFLAQGVFVP